MGLLQLMPALGKRLAKEENIPFSDDFALFNEATNINLGAKELSQLLQRNKNNYIAAIAGYNASPAAFQGWIKSRYRPNVVEFIEEIPYEETRTYIKLIIRNMIFYDRIYFQKQDFNFPEFLLSLN
jgi:soluble lytic murein transglycosylase